MYLPKGFKVEDPKQILEIVNANPFATIISVKEVSAKSV